MSFDFETKISAKFIDEKTIVLNPKMQNILTERGFGELQNNTFWKQFHQYPFQEYNAFGGDSAVEKHIARHRRYWRLITAQRAQ